jgi:uncharacterized protein with NAD-binding domain and iron-sulfur cluster
MFSTGSNEKYMFEEGDKYIQFTKYGSINKGVIKHCGVVNCIDTNNGVSYQKPYIVNEKNIHYDLDGNDGRFYKVTVEYTKEECEQMVQAYKKLMELKDNRRQKIMESFKKTRQKKNKKDLVETKLDDVIKTQFNEDNIS